MRIHTAGALGALVRDRRRAAGLSQDALAARAGVSRRWLAALEAGKVTAELGLVLRTLDALGLTVSVDVSAPTTGNIDLDEVLSEFDRDTP